MSAVKLRTVRDRAIKVANDFYKISGYSDLPINFPNKVFVDVEHRKEPFLSVEFDVGATALETGRSPDTLAVGTLYFIYNMIEGSGTGEAYDFCDRVNDLISNRVVDGLQYGVADPIMISPYPGWAGLMVQVNLKTTSDAGDSCN